MAENKFIEHLKGKTTAKSLVEIQNQATPASFANMPQGTSNAIDVYSDHRGNSTVVANGTVHWKIDGSSLIPASTLSGDGNDFLSVDEVSGAGLWVNSVYTFSSTGDPNHPVAMIFNPNTKWVLKLCGDSLISTEGNTVDLTLLITFGSSTVISKQFTVNEQAGQFCKELVIDFSESNTNIIKAQGLSTMRVQVLCGTSSASARIYNGMTAVTVLQRKVEAAAVSSTFANVEEVLRDGIIPSDYFNNQAYIVQVNDGDTAYAVFQRDGDEMLFVGWDQPIPDQSGNSGKFLTTDGSLLSWAQLTISDVDSLQTELSDLQNQIDDLSGRGRFLSVWNCVTGLAETNPPESPYPYKAGDYFIVGTVSSADPAVNYKPDGSSYTTGVASTVVESAEVNIDDTYIYDGTTWKLQANSQRTYTFAGIAGSPYDNTDLANALNSKANATNRVNGAALSNATSNFYGVSNTAAATVQKEVSIPSITSLDTGTIIIVQPTVTSTVANSTLKLNDFDAYPMRYNNAAITTSTDSIVWSAAYPSIWVFDGTYWVFAGHGLDSNTTYTLNYSVDAGQYTAGSGTYAVTRYSILAQKADGTWEKITATNASYSTGTSKSVNTSGFILNQLRYYGTTTAVASGVKIATNVLYEKAASVDMRYSTNCGGTTTWALGDYIYLVGTIGADGLFYLDTTTWWSNALPTTNDGKLYIRLGLALVAASYTMSFFEDRPIFYHDGIGIKEYKVADNKQDVISDLATIRSGASAGATAVQPNDNVSVLINDAKYLSNTATATDAITVLGTANTTWTNGINIGKDSRINSNNGIAIGVEASADVNAVGIGRDADAGVRGTAIGAYAKTSYDTGIAIGCWNANTNNAVSGAKGAYQFGVGTNSTPRTLNVGWYNDSVSPSTFVNYQLLDGDTGLIPDARISTNIARTSALPNVMTGATAGDAGTSGLVPAPAAGDQAKFLQGDGTWANPTAATAWGNITGTLSNQTDLQNVLNGKADKDLDNLSSDGEERVFQPGIVLPFAGSTAPSGWLFCDGSAVSRTTYAKLFAAIGTTYGTGDGSTTFNLPNLIDRIPWYGGSTVGTVINGGLPDIQAQLQITNGASVLNLDGFYGYGALALASTTRSVVHYSTYTNPVATGHDTLDFHASRVASAYGRYSNNKVIPEGLQMYWCIKY